MSGKLFLLTIMLFAPAAAHAWPWSQDMANQISIKPQEGNEAAQGMRPFPKRSVPAAGTIAFVKDREAAYKIANPVPADERSVARGERLFGIYCVPCHGKSGTGDGPVGEKLSLKPFNLTSSNEFHSWDPKEYPDGYIWGYMTFGGAVMPSYANDLTQTERWHVVNYIRKVLQGGGRGAETPARPQ